tara:strand:- start:1 stop:480 length:480 start_codon:yes stop_codon:yes gene_type:complete
MNSSSNRLGRALGASLTLFSLMLLSPASAHKDLECPRVSPSLGTAATGEFFSPSLKSRASRASGARQGAQNWVVRDRACAMSSIDRKLVSAADHQTTEAVIKALQSDGRLKGEIEVTTFNGVVTLIGRVKSVSMLYRSVELAEGVDGVRAVDDGPLHVL